MESDVTAIQQMKLYWPVLMVHTFYSGNVLKWLCLGMVLAHTFYLDQYYVILTVWKNKFVW